MEHFPPIDLSLSKQKHLWLMPMDTAFDEKQKNLSFSQEEVERGNRFYFSEDRKRYFFYRHNLRKILSIYSKQRPESINIQYSIMNKPFLRNNPKNLNFNLSHTTDLAIYALTLGDSIGVDIEEINKDFDFDALSKSFFSKKEKSALANLKGINKRMAFYSIWTGKEAYGKAVGFGITYPLDQLVIPISSLKYLKTTFSGLEGEPWELQRFIFKYSKKQYVVSCVSKISKLQNDTVIIHLENSSELTILDFIND